MKAASLVSLKATRWLPSIAENSNDRMSVAQKEWPVRGRILMVRTSKPNQDPGEKKSLSGAVALITGGSRGIGRAIARQPAILGASVAICGRDIAALEEAALDVAKLGVPVHRKWPTLPNRGTLLILSPKRKPS